MAHTIDGKLVTEAGYEPRVGDPITIRGVIQEIANGVAIVVTEDGSLASVVVDMMEYDDLYARKAAVREAERDRQGDRGQEAGQETGVAAVGAVPVPEVTSTDDVARDQPSR